MKISSRQIMSEVRALYGRHLRTNYGPSPSEGAPQPPGVQMVSSDFFTDVVLGRVPGMGAFTIRGHIPDIDNGQERTVWPFPSIYAPLQSSSTIEVVSSDAGDATGGAGAIAMTITGIDGTLAEVEESITLAGTTPVVLSTQMLAVNDAVITQFGSSGTNTGLITVREQAGVSLRGIEPAGTFDRSGVYTVPAGKTLLIYELFATSGRSAGGAGTLEVSFFLRQSVSSQLVYINGVNLEKASATTFENDFTIPRKITSGSVIESRASSDTNNMEAITTVFCILVDTA